MSISHLEKSLFEIRILEAGEEAPKKLKVTVRAGPEALRARTWEVGSNYGEAVAQFTAKLMFERAGDESVKDATATCVGADGSKYTVRFTLRFPFREEGLDFPVTGTVTIAPGAWRSALDLKGHMDAEVKNSTSKALVINSTMSLRSTLTKK